MLGIDLVLPDFAYLRERVDDIEAIVITHGHEDHLGALPWVLRELGEDNVPVVYGGRLTIAMARSKLDEHKLARRPLEELDARRHGAELGPFELELVHMTHSIPDSAAVALTHRARAPCWSPATTSSTRPRSTARPPTSRGWPSWAREGVLLLCGDSTNADRPGFSPVGVAASGRTSRRPSRAARAASS